MIRELLIKNLALIDSLQLSFSEGLTVLTGETGAGKSIILQAIALLMGGRTTAAWIRSGADSASVEACFEIAPTRTNLLEELHAQGIDVDDGTLIIKRSLSSQGKSRYSINGSLVTARQVGELATDLLSVASQHDQHHLLAPARHLDFIDALGGLWPQRQELAEMFQRWTDLKEHQRALLQQEKDKEQRRDFLTFQRDEISAAAIIPDEDARLTAVKSQLRSADTLLQLGRESHYLLTETIHDALARTRKNLEQIAGLDASATDLAVAVAESAYLLADQADRLRDYLDNIVNDPDRLEEVESRLDLLQRLKRKYGGPQAALAAVLAHAENATTELTALEDMDQELAELGRQLTATTEELRKKAAALSAARREQALQLAVAMGRELRSLCLEDAIFEVRFADHADLDQVGPTGWDRPEFMFSANQGEPVKPLALIASGGERSRLLLALKCLLAREDQVETVIFDEVDAGIGGKAAESLARKIQELAGHHQVLCITHLPQIAAAATEHFLVSKSLTDERTTTAITLLNRVQRVSELARMLAGESITRQTLAYAEELLTAQS